MRRREFISVLAGAATWPLAVSAQPKPPIVGWLSSGSADVSAGRIRALHQGLAEQGFMDGRNVAIDYRWSGDRYDLLPALAADLVRSNVSAIGAFGGILGALAAKSATTMIPIVFATGDDPVANGLVSSLSRPGGNITGVSLLSAEPWPKRLELAGELAPAGVLALLVNPTLQNADALTQNLRDAARMLGRDVHIAYASSAEQIAAAFVQLAELQVRAVVIGSDPFFNNQSGQLAQLGLRYRIPTIYQYQEFVTAGGLMSYGGSITDGYRIVGGYLGRILKGEKPVDLPVQQSTRIELVINMKSAKALGLTLPITLLGRADEVIE